MLLDARTVPSGSTLSSDVCIVGAGAAGITLARELKNRASVILIESGDLEFNGDIHDLYRGTVAGNMWELAAKDDEVSAAYLQTSRHHYFGGSTNCWDGYCRPLDESVFAERDWVPHSGWPIGEADLDGYYEKVAHLCDIETQYRENGAANGRRFPSGIGWQPAIEYRSPPTRFGLKYRDELEDAERVTTCLLGTVTDLVTNAPGDAIERIEVKTLEGNSFEVESEIFILASGGIENARILLNSDRVHNTGVGNADDLVGRFFMEHLYPAVLPGFAALTRTSWDGVAEYDQFGIWTLGRDTIQAHGLLNVGLAFGKFRGSRKGLNRSVLATTATLDRHGTVDARAPERSLLTQMRLHVELAPHRDNRITLSDELDRMGMRRVKLNWNLSELDKYSMDKSLELYVAELGRAAAGRAAIGGLLMRGSYGSHHMGTTRMSHDPRTGVVDANCLVHGVSNLYIAGSSVFPAVGFENPTFTILALALRLADHIRRRRDGGGRHGAIPRHSA
jgi:choline dehydrogenase-like flavoprotein